MGVVAIIAAGLLLAQPSSTASKRSMEVEDVLALSSVTDPQISPDGRFVAYVVTERDDEENINDSDIWIVATDDGDPIRLTYHRGSDDSPRWTPDGSWLGFLSDRGDKKQVFGIRPQGGEAWPITDWKTDVESFRVSPDGERIAFVAKPEKSEKQEEYEKERGRPDVWDEAYTDEWSHLWVAVLEEGRAGEAERFSPDELYVSNFIWSPDSKKIAFAGRPSPALRAHSLGNVYITSEPGPKTRPVTAMRGGESPVAWSEAHELLVSGTGQIFGTYNRMLWKVPTSRGGAISLTDGLDENAGYVAITDHRLLVEASDRTGRGLYSIDLEGKKAERLTDEKRFYQSFSATKDGSKVAFLADSGSEPTNVYVSGTESFAPKRLTDINSQMEELLLGEQRVVRWPSRADGEEIEGILTLPVGYREGEPVALLLVIHGGPSGVSSDRFSPRGGAYPIQVFAGKGYAVLQPNYRGSTGYGERFRGLNRGDISGRDWVDIDSGVDAMIERGIADPDRLGIMGWSFGGHHTYWGITQTDRYKAASAGAGANDLVSMYSQTDLPEFYHTYLGPKPWEDFDLYEERSAYRNVAKVATPLLIQVGEKDERVPAEQSIQFYEAVKSIGKVETELVIYPEQPHGVRDPRLSRDLMIRNVEWFMRWIPPGGTRTTDGGVGLRGFTSDETPLQREWEEKFRAIPQPSNLRQYMKASSAEPHHAGGTGSKKVAEYILSRYESWGLNAWIEEYEAFMPMPTERVLELVHPEPYIAKLDEPAVAGDEDTSDSGRLPTFNAYSADGDVTGELVYVNYGIPEDYERLAEMGIEVEGKVVIVRYGRSWRGIKVKMAQEHGAIGCLIYSDPQQDGYFQGDVYPNGPYRPQQGVQRGSVMDMPVHPGDPLTPGWGSEKGGRKLGLSEAQTLVKIPVLPISYGDALPLLENIGGAVAPEDWRGALPTTYHVGPGPARVHMKLSSEWKHRALYNVLARIDGAVFPDEWIVQGNHHDAWVNGANDPTSGNVAMMESARAMAELQKQGWKPKRTILFASWDGEEWGLLGSTEWAEKHAAELREKAVLYINTDSNGKGWLSASGSHSLQKIINEVARDITDPETGKSIWEAARTRRLEQAGSEEEARAIREQGDLSIGALGSGSDYTAFLDHLNVASLNVGFGGAGGSGIGHSIYDTFAWYTRFADPEFEYGRALSQTAGTLILRMASATVLPFHFVDYANTLGQYVDEIEETHRQMKDSPAVDLTPLREAIGELRRAGRSY